MCTIVDYPRDIFSMYHVVVTPMNNATHKGEDQENPNETPQDKPQPNHEPQHSPLRNNELTMNLYEVHSRKGELPSRMIMLFT